MKAIHFGVIVASCTLAAGVCIAAASNDLAGRKELKRVDLSGAPGMEAIESVSEYHKGDEIPRHIHHGIETGYVLQGTMVQYPGKDPVMVEAGTPVLNLRDVVHGGFKVVGDTPYKTFTVHIVDKDKPLYDWVN
jgi:quercetin dioxygenase-like cupin family protein